MNGVAVYLPIEDWNKVLSILAQAPWNLANPLIMAMGEQLRAAQSTAVPSGSDPKQWQEGQPRPNGADRP